MANCRGCYYYYSSDETPHPFICIYSQLGYDLDSVEGCPCKTCLVKVTCKRRCEDFMTYFNTKVEPDEYYLRDGLIFRKMKEGVTNGTL